MGWQVIDENGNIKTAVYEVVVLPALTEDYVWLGNASDVATQYTMTQLAAKLTASSITGYQGYTLIAWGGGSISPLDATTYYSGVPQLSTTTTANVKRVYIPKTGTIRSAYLTFNVGGTLSSGETFSAWIRINNTTDVLISASCLMSSINPVFSNSALSTAVTAGDYFELKYTTPTWATNPTTVNSALTIYID